MLVALPLPFNITRTTTLWHRLCGLYNGVGYVAGGKQGHIKGRGAWIALEVPAEFLGNDLIFRARLVGIYIKVNSTPKSADRYKWSTTLGITIFPSGSTTTKNCFIGVVILVCSAPSLAIAICSLAIPERVELPNEIRRRTIGSANKSAATITDNRNKSILYPVVRPTAPIGCRITASSEP
jgi:hypothetical protein